MTGQALKHDCCPPRIRSLEPYSQRFEAFRLAGRCRDALFTNHPAGTRIGAYIRGTAEIEFRFAPEGGKS